MPEAYESLRAWAGDSRRLHERVLGDGRHHVWVSVFAGCRRDCVHRDFAFACEFLWAWLLDCGFANDRGAQKEQV